MINRLHLILYGILLLIILGLFAAFKILSDKLSSAEGFKDLYESEQKVSKQWKDNANHWHSKAESVQISADDMQHIKELAGLPAEVSGLKQSMKNLQSYNQVAIESNTHRQIVLKDTILNITGGGVTHVQVFDDTTNKFEEYKGSVVNGKLDIDRIGKDTLEIVQYWDRKCFICKKHYENEVLSKDTTTKIPFNRSIIAKRKKGLFAL